MSAKYTAVYYTHSSHLSNITVIVANVGDRFSKSCTTDTGIC